MFFYKVAATVTFLLIRHQVLVAEAENVTFTEDNLTTVDYENENETSTTEYPYVSFHPPGYLKWLPTKDNSTEIYLTILSFAIDRHLQYCNLTVVIKFNWTDQRLFGGNPWWNSTEETSYDLKLNNIWAPRFFLRHLTKINDNLVIHQDFIQPQESDREYVTGFKHFSYVTGEMTLKLGTQLNFKKFPADRHHYAFQLAHGCCSYHDYYKKYHAGLVANLDEDLVFDIKVKVAHFTMYPESKFAVCITLQRRIGNYVIQTYIPSGLFIILSWLSMFLPLDIATERVALCTATLLTLTTFTSSTKFYVPEISYMTGLDLWNMVSTSFIFLILVENISVLRIMAKKSENVSRSRVTQGIVEATTKINYVGIMKLKKEGEENMTNSTSNQKQDVIQAIGEAPPCQDSKSKEWKALAGKLDNLSAAVIAVAWIIFNVIYWIWLFDNEDLLPKSSTPVEIVTFVENKLKELWG